ncbi:MAG TPA: YIP1 family protein [Verrucomicrobiae bacterium]
MFFLIFEPTVTWDRVALKQRGFGYIFFTYLLPFVLLATAVEGWGLATYGKWQPKVQRIREFSDTTVFRFEIIQALLLLAVVFVSAKLLQIASESFHGRRDFLPTFTTVAYGFSPMLLVYMFNASPNISPWIPWGLGVAATIWILYTGIARVLQPLPVHAFGIYLSAAFIVVLVSGLARLITAMYLLGQINLQQSPVTRLIGQWLGQ